MYHEGTLSIKIKAKIVIVNQGVEKLCNLKHLNALGQCVNFLLIESKK